MTVGMEKREEGGEIGRDTPHSPWLASISRTCLLSYNLGSEEPQKDGLVPPKGSETLTPKEKGVFTFSCRFSLGSTGHGKAISIMGVTQSQLIGNVCRVPRSPTDCRDLENLPVFPGLPSPDPQTQHAVFSRTSRA